MKKALLFSLSLMGQIGFAIAIPLAGLGLLGYWLDNRYHPGKHYLAAIGIILAAIITFFYLKKIVKEAVRHAAAL